MGRAINDVSEYILPYKQHSRLKVSHHVLYLGFVALFLFIFIFSFITKESKMQVIMMRVLGLVCTCAFFVMWFYTGVLRKNYIELTDEYLKINTLLKKSVIKWDEIYDISVYTQGYNTILGILLKEKMKKRKNNFLTILNDMFGGTYSAQIAFVTFPHIDIERLYFTITKKIIESSNSNEIDEIDVDAYSVDSTEDVPSSNLVFALLRCVLVSIVSGIVYGFSIFILESNFVIIPIVSCIAIIYTYNKYYNEENINIITRMILGIISVMQVFVGVITAIFLSSKIEVTFKNVIEIIIEYFKYVIEDPSEQAVILLIAIIIFFTASLQGYKFRFQRILTKILMKKKNKYYYKREGKLVNIYLIDPVNYNEQNPTNLAAIIYRDCLIEAGKKSVKAFYLPTEPIEELGCSIKYTTKVDIDNKSYYMLDLGSSGKYKRYVFPCLLKLDQYKNVELIEIQLK